MFMKRKLNVFHFRFYWENIKTERESERERETVKLTNLINF